jgi:hypothetical protein
VALATATLLALAAWLLPDRIDARVMSGIREQIVWQPDSPEPVAGEHADDPPAPNSDCAATSDTRDKVIRSFTLCSCASVQPVSVEMLTPALRLCMPATDSSTSPTLRRCDRAPSPPW